MKTATAAIIAGMMLAMASVVSAAPVEISGGVVVKYEADNFAGMPEESGMSYTLTLRGEKTIGRGLSVYGRFGAQYTSNPVLTDADLVGYARDVKAVATIDQFGMIYRSNKFVYKLGRQDSAVGVTKLLYSRPDSNIGNNAFVDGLSVTGRTGAVDVAAIAARENNIWMPNNSLYAIRASYNLSKNTSMGITMGQYQYYSSETSNHWAVDAAATFGKSTLTAEYTQSNNSTENKAYAITWNYKYNDKTAAYVTNFRVEANGDMGRQSDFDNNNRGFYFGITHAFTNKLSMEMVYKDQVALAENNKNSKMEATLTYAF